MGLTERLWEESTWEEHQNIYLLLKQGLTEDADREG